MTKKKENSIAISLNDGMLQAVQVKGKGLNGKVTNIAVRKIEGENESQLAKSVHSALNGFAPQKSDIVYAIPQSVTTTKMIEVPSVDPEEIKSIVSLQAGRHTPFSREEIQVGYINLGVYNSNYSKVLLVIANKNDLIKSLEAFDKAGLHVQKIVFAPEGMARFYSKALQLKETDSPVGLIDIGQKTTDFIIVSKGVCIASRSIPIGRTQLVQDGPVVQEKLVEELSQTIESYKNEDGDATPSDYVLTGADEPANQLQSLLKEKLGWDAQPLAYLDQIKAAAGVVKKIGREAADISFLPIIGPAAFLSEMDVDLMPDEVRMKKTVKLQGKEVFRTAVLVFVLLVLGATSLGLKIFFRNSVLKKIKRDNSAQRQAVVSLENRSIQTQILRNYMESRMISLDAINELCQKIPEEIYLTNLFMNENGKIHIQGISDISSLVFNLGTTLKESELFKSVEIISTTSKKDRGKDVTAFEISLSLMGMAEEEASYAAETEETP